MTAPKCALWWNDMKLYVQSENHHFKLTLPNFLLCTPLVYLALRKNGPITYASARSFCVGLHYMKTRLPGVPLVECESSDSHITLFL